MVVNDYIKNHSLYLEEVTNVAKCTYIRWEKLKEKTVLITGASGMIGSYLVDLLLERNEKYNDNITVIALSRNIEKLEYKFERYKHNSSLVLIQHDITKKLNIKEKVDYIIHAASNTHPIEYSAKPIETITTNVLGLNNVLEFASTQDRCRVMVLSSVEIYGENNTNSSSYDEFAMGYINCNSLRAGYPESKRLSEAMLQAYISERNIAGVVARLCRVYGPGIASDDSKALTQFIRNGTEGNDIVLKSNGEQYYSYIYVADACVAILKILLDGAEGEAYNVADERSDITLKDLAGIIAKNTGKKVIFDLPSKEEIKGFSIATKAVLDASKLKNLGWSATFSIEEGIKKTLEIMK